MPRDLGNTKYYDPREVAIILDRHYETALGRMRENRISSVKINNGYLVSHEDLVQYLDEEEALPESIIDLRLNGTPINDAAPQSDLS